MTEIIKTFHKMTEIIKAFHKMNEIIRHFTKWPKLLRHFTKWLISQSVSNVYTIAAFMRKWKLNNINVFL